MSESTLPIVGGTAATECQWPSTVMLIGPSVCSGTLVHPRAVVTAKHCVMDESQTWPSPPAMVGFGESREHWARTVAVTRCYVHPSNDIGLCILGEDVTNVPIVPIMAPCETPELLPGRPIVEVGFGVIGAKSKSYGTKKWINGVIENRSASLVDILVTTGSQDGEYFGDSGGPLHFKMPDQTWRLIGEDCCSDDISDGGPRISTYTSVPYHVPWMEEQSGLDLTPCHDLGGWNPGASCVGSPTNPGTGVGPWTGSCQGQTLLRAQTCAASPHDARAMGDVREAASWDGALDSRLPDLTVDDSSPDSAFADGPDSADGLSTLPDGLEAGEPSMDAETASPTADARTEPVESAIPVDAGQDAIDSAVFGFDTSAHEVHLDLAGGPDSRASADTGSEAGRPNDGASDSPGPVIRGGGCACRTGAPRSAGGWPMLISFGLVGALGPLVRRRRDAASPGILARSRACFAHAHRIALGIAAASSHKRMRA